MCGGGLMGIVKREKGVVKGGRKDGVGKKGPEDRNKALGNKY